MKKNELVNRESIRIVVIDENNNILILENNDRFGELHFPRVIYNPESDNYTGTFTLSPEDFEALEEYYSFVWRELRYESENGHLIPFYLETTKKFYLYRGPLTEQMHDELMDQAYRQGYNPDFINLEYVNDYLNVNDVYKVEKGFKPAIKSLYTKIEEEGKKNVRY